MSITIYAPKRSFTIISPAGSRQTATTKTFVQWVDEADHYIVDEAGHYIVFAQVDTIQAIKIVAPKRSFTIISPAR